MKDRFAVCGSVCNQDNVINGKGYRITIIADGLFRLELSPKEIYTDEPTQTVWYRDLGKVDFAVERQKRGITVKTARAIFWFNGDLAAPNVGISFGKGMINAFSHAGNLKGTVRTLDFRNGSVPLKTGLLSKQGVSVIDDSSTYILDENGLIAPRKARERDLYVFAYGRDYKACLKAFYGITGNVPLLPRYALGNWWSRYYDYSEESYLALMNEFEKRQIPLSVATIDMDWHIVKGVPREAASHTIQGSGWTGYTWNTELFPDYKRFLKKLKDMGLAVTLNLHPRDGIRCHEIMYPEMARAMGIDPESKLPVEFDMTDPKFIENYFDIVHHPYEKDGVDFWWIDWQQGTKTKYPGLDPLWLLNHYHFLDNGREHRPLILSRYAKAGSHRYPLGFSGDVIISWRSLKFQPYFTANASNIGYGWWSHDIGGHTFGAINDELYLRWLQFGVFSPINRLHSTKGKFMGKEPWLLRADVYETSKDYMRLRARMLPYLYTMNKRASEGEPLIQPLYYSNPNDAEAYKQKNEYWFGSELIVAPITEKCARKFLRSGVRVWLPEGRWTDIFTGESYSGGKHDIFRRLDSIPVLAKEGAILPLQRFDDKAAKPAKLEIWAFAGDGEFVLYEDDGVTPECKLDILDQPKTTETRFKISKCDDKVRFEIFDCVGEPVKGRTYNIVLKGVLSANVSVDGVRVSGDEASAVVSAGAHVIEFSQLSYPASVEENDRLEDVLQDYHANIMIRQAVFGLLRRAKTKSLKRAIITLAPIAVKVKRALFAVL